MAEKDVRPIGIVVMLMDYDAVWGCHHRNREKLAEHTVVQRLYLLSYMSPALMAYAISAGVIGRIRRRMDMKRRKKHWQEYCQQHPGCNQSHCFCVHDDKCNTN